MTKQTEQKPRLRNRYDFKLKDTDMEYTKGKSLTVQDDSFTIKEILEKYTRGIDPMITKLGHFPDEEPDEDDMDLEKFNRLEIGEQNEIVKETMQKGKNAEKRLKEVQTAKEKAELEKALKAKIEAETKKKEADLEKPKG